MKLTDTICRRKPGPATVKLSDGGGLYLQVNPTGTRYWRMGYRFGGKQKKLSFGVYPDMPLALARERRDAARALLARDIDPAAQRKEEKRQAEAAKPFREIAEDWFQTKMVAEGFEPRTITRGRQVLDHLLDSDLAERPIGEIDAPELLAVLRKVEADGRLETASRMRGFASRICRFGIASGTCKRDIAADLIGVLTTPKVVNRPTLTEPAAVGTLMRDMRDYSGRDLTSRALEALALTFVRPGELRHMEWAEIDTAAATWSIPKEKMKMKLPHAVPLSRQMLALIEVMRPVTGTGRYVFGAGGGRAPLSDNTFNKALRVMGYNTQTEHCAHGFRSTASTLLNEELKFSPDVIELQLAHVDDNTVRATYNRAKLWPERVKLMQHWADRLDIMRDGAQVVALTRRAITGRDQSAISA